MLVELYIFAFFSVAYGTLITLAIIGFGRLKQNPIFQISKPNAFISIVVSARNEANCIEDFIKQIVKQKFPRDNFELIVIDDDSNDNTFLLASELLSQSDLNYQLIKQNNHVGKKKNIASAIQKAKGIVIITTDADVIERNPLWLSTIAYYFETHKPDMLIMPIDFEDHSNILSSFQIVENLALTGVTAGFIGINKAFMCNGANLAFLKKTFDLVNGYDGHLQYSSGEDVFLLEDFKLVKNNKIHYGLMPELIVKTKPLLKWTEFLNQRLRWASKAKGNSNPLNLFTGFVILGANLLMLACLVAFIQKSPLISYLLVFIISKIVFDFLLLFLASDFLRRYKYLWLVFPFQCVYWIYALCIGIGSLIVKPKWKEKKIT